MSKRLRVAVCDTPKKVQQALSEKLSRAGYDVVYAGPLRDKTKGNTRFTSEQAKRSLVESDVWLTKWSFCLKGKGMIFDEVTPRLGLVTLSVGKDHIDLDALAKLGLRVENCPTFCSNSVAEHAMALAMGGLYQQQESILPPLSSGKVVFANFSDEYAESAVAQMLRRARQLDDSVQRARKKDYERYDAPWENEELSSAKIGIVGNDRSAKRLAKMLKLGFDCELLGCRTSDELARYRIRNMNVFEVMDNADYVFVCGEEYDSLESANTIDSVKALTQPHMEMFGSRVAVLATGRIGSIIASMAHHGFDCKVTAFDKTRSEDLIGNVEYIDSIGEAISKANFIFIALPLTANTERLLGREALSGMSSTSPHVLVNVTRDEIVDSQFLFECIKRGMVMAYGTDVLPEDKVLWAKGAPSVLTMKFIYNSSVVPTPHEGDASRHSLDRLCDEALDKLERFEGD
jgi:lactate dehydrogenase-like 2-hydroxyacid dehydrogenase